MSAQPGYAVIGGGALGQVFSAVLAAADRPVTLFVRSRALAPLVSAGALHVTGAIELVPRIQPAPAPPGTIGLTADPSDLRHADGLIFTTKAHQLDELAEPIARATERAVAWVAGLQNGLAKDDCLAAAFGRDRVVGAATVLGARRDDLAHAVVTGLGTSFFGEFEADRPRRATDFCQALREGGLTCEEPADIRSLLWTKACNAVGIFGLAALTHLPTSDFMRQPAFLRVYHSLIEEAASVAAADGVEIGDYTSLPIRTYLRDTPDQFVSRLLAAAPPEGGHQPVSISSLGQDLDAGRPTESDQVFGDLLRRARARQLSVPGIGLLAQLLAGINQLNRDRGSRTAAAP